MQKCSYQETNQNALKGQFIRREVCSPIEWEDVEKSENKHEDWVESVAKYNGKNTESNFQPNVHWLRK